MSYAPGPLCDLCLPKPAELCTKAHGLRRCLLCNAATGNGCPTEETFARARRAQMDTLDEIGGVSVNDTEPSPPPEPEP